MFFVVAVAMVFIYYFFVLFIYRFTAEYLVPNIGTPVWLLFIISQVYADDIYIVYIIIAVDWFQYKNTVKK